VVLCHGIDLTARQNPTQTMFFRIAMTSSRTVECALGIAPVFAALSPIIRWLNTANRFAYSKREVLFAT
jgi:hypothetical protein